MCYYNGVKLLREKFIRLKQIELALEDHPFDNPLLLNGFDYGHSPVLKKSASGDGLELVEMEWGFLPHYITTRLEADKFRYGFKKDNGQFQPPVVTLNATSEEMLRHNKIFREAALSRRCLVLSTGFFEWRHVFPVNKRTGKPLKTPVKYPYRIGLKDKSYFFLAGIWQPWKDVETGEYVETYSIITTAANSLMAQIHNSRQRMPTILTEDLAWEWVFGNLAEEEISAIARFQFPASQLEVCTIAKDFRESAEPEAPFEYKELPAIELKE